MVEWSAWIKRAQGELAESMALPINMIRPHGEPLSDKERVHREEWIEDVAQAIGRTAEAFMSSLIEDPQHSPPQSPENQSPSQNSE